MTEYDRAFAEFEALCHRQRASSRQMLKALSTSRAQPLLKGLPAARPQSQESIDLLKAETTLRALQRAGALTDQQAGEAWRRLHNLRPETIIPLH